MCIKKNKIKQENRPMPESEYFIRASYLRKVSVWVLSLSIFVLFVIALFKAFIPCIPHGLIVLLDFLSAISASLIAGAIITRAVDLPNLVRSFQDLVVNSFTSKVFLDELDPTTQISLKDDLVKRIHKDNDIPDSLIKLDSNLSDIIDQAYYSYFNEYVTCYKKESYENAVDRLNSFKGARLVQQPSQTIVRPDQAEESTVVAQPNKLTCPPKPNSVEGFYVVKDIINEFELINPGKKSCKVDIGLRKSLDLPEKNKVSEMFYLQELSVVIDESDRIDINVNVETFSRKPTMRSSSETMTYNSTLGLVVPFGHDTESNILTKSNLIHFKRDQNKEPAFSSKENDSPSVLMVEFESRVRVRIKYYIILSANDTHFTRRMRYSAQSFLCEYSSEDNVQIHGQVLGTLVKQEQISINQCESDRKRISIQCRGWLLPGNGIFIVLDDKYQKKDE